MAISLLLPRTICFAHLLLCRIFVSTEVANVTKLCWSCFLLLTKNFSAKPDNPTHLAPLHSQLLLLTLLLHPILPLSPPSESHYPEALSPNVHPNSFPHPLLHFLIIQSSRRFPLFDLRITRSPDNTSMSCFNSCQNLASAPPVTIPASVF